MEGRIVKAFVLGLLLVALLTVIGVYRVWQNYRVVQLGNDLAKASRTLRTLQSDNDMLDAQYHALRSSPAVLGKAQACAMRLPMSTEIVTVQSKDTERVGKEKAE
jgi:cell division protein FtsB